MDTYITCNMLTCTENAIKTNKDLVETTIKKNETGAKLKQRRNEYTKSNKTNNKTVFNPCVASGPIPDAVGCSRWYYDHEKGYCAQMEVATAATQV